jgi:hypothetical protein
VALDFLVNSIGAGVIIPGHDSLQNLQPLWSNGDVLLSEAPGQLVKGSFHTEYIIL